MYLVARIAILQAALNKMGWNGLNQMTPQRQWANQKKQKP
jgi:hypothetical protein